MCVDVSILMIQLDLITKNGFEYRLDGQKVHRNTDEDTQITEFVPFRL